MQLSRSIVSCFSILLIRMICHYYYFTKSISKTKSIYQKNVQFYQQYKKLVPVIHGSNLNIFLMTHNLLESPVLHLIPVLCSAHAYCSMDSKHLTLPLPNVKLE